MSVYISNLPEYTGNTYNGYIVWNDSGETTTYKTKYQPGLVKGTGTDSIKSADDLTSTNANASGTDSIAIGKGAYANGEDSVSIGNTFGTQVGYRSVAIGRHPYPSGNSNTIIGSGAYVYGNNNICIGHETSVSNNGIVLGSNVTRANGNYAISLGHNNESNIGEYSALLGYGNRIGSFNYNGDTYNNGGSYNYLLSNNSRIGNLGSTNWTGNTIVGGNSNVIISSGNTNTILNGGGNIISGTTSGTTLIGLNNFTPTQNDTAYVEHLTSLGQINNGYYDNLSGDTFTIDWNNGNSQKVYMTGDTSLDFTNVRNGAQYRLQVVNGGTHSITGATASGYTILCEGGSIPNITNNGVDLCILEVMDTDILVRHFANFATP